MYTCIRVYAHTRVYVYTCLCVYVHTRVYVYTCPCVDLAYSCIRAPVYTCEAGLLVPIGGFEAGLLVAYSCLRWLECGFFCCLRYWWLLVGNLCLNRQMVSSRFGEFVVEMWSYLLPSLFMCSSGKSLSKLEDGFQAIWVFWA